MAAVRLLPLAIFATIWTAGCSSPTPTTTTKETGMTRKISSAPWGKTKDGEQIDLYTLTNAKGAETTVTTYGGRVVTLKVPDHAGNVDDVVLVFDSADGYLRDPPPH